MEDPYRVLGIDGWVTAKQLEKAYRKRAPIYNPAKNNSPNAAKKLKQLKNAYEYLLDEKRRKKYDEERKRRLGNGAKTSKGHTYKHKAPNAGSTKFRFSKPADGSFLEIGRAESREGSKDAGNAGDPKAGTKGFTSQKDSTDTKGPFIFTGSGDDQSTQLGKNDEDSASVIELGVTLEEMATGVVKDVNICLTVENDDGTTNMEKLILTVNVKPGWRAGTKITFPNEVNGDTDLVIIIREKPHQHFRRRGNDLLYTAKVTKEQALRGADIDVPTLTGDKLSVYLPPRAINGPNMLKKFEGRGLPSLKDPSTKGDLIVNFELKTLSL